MSTTLTDRLAALREPPPEPPTKQTRVITVRLPREQHERLKVLANRQQVSLNQLCVVALEQAESEVGAVDAAKEQVA